MKPVNAVKKLLADLHPDALFADGLEDAVIGYVERFGMEPIALYDREKCIKILISEGMSEEEAEEHFGFNIIGGWVGEGTPAFATLVKPGKRV